MIHSFVITNNDDANEEREEFQILTNRLIIEKFSKNVNRGRFHEQK